jgi:hypothetical protein
MRHPATLTNHVPSALALLLVLTGWACGKNEPEHHRFGIELRALTTSDQGVPGSRFWADGRELGVTDASGALHASVDGREGRAVWLSNACPPAYRALTPNRRLVLRHTRAAQASATPALELTARCEPLARRAALVVRARGPEVAGLPIRANGETVGQTGLDGSAHLLLSVRPHAALRVQLITAAHPELVPRDPVQSFELEDDDSILLVDQELARPPKPRPRERPTRPPQRAVLPYRIGPGSR